MFTLANHVIAYTLSRLPCFLLVRRVWDISSGIGPCFPLARGLFKQRWRKMTKTAPITVCAIQAAIQPTFNNVQLYSTCEEREWQKQADNIIKPTQTRIYWKKYMNGSVNLEGHLKKLNKNMLDAYLRPRSIHYVIKSPIWLVRQSPVPLISYESKTRFLGYPTLPPPLPPPPP